MFPFKVNLAPAVINGCNSSDEKGLTDAALLSRQQMRLAAAGNKSMLLINDYLRPDFQGDCLQKGTRDGIRVVI